MLPRVRPSVALLLLILLFAGGGAWLWRNLRVGGADGDDSSPRDGSSRHAVEFLSKDEPAVPPPPEEHGGPGSERTRAARETSRASAAEPAAADGLLSGQLLDSSGRAVHEARIYLAPWIEDETEPQNDEPGELDPLDSSERSRRPLVPARIAVHLPLDVAAPEAAGLPVPLSFAPDDSGAFRAPLPAGRWRLLVRSPQAPYERNDLLLAAGESRDLGRIVLRPGLVYRFHVRDSHGNPTQEIRAAPLLTGLGAEFPPLQDALAIPFFASRANEKDKETRTSIAQRPYPLSLRLAGPNSRALLVELSPANPTITLRLPEADHLRGGLDLPDPPLLGSFSVHAGPLDFFAASIPTAFRADLARAPAGGHSFDLLLPDRNEVYELRAAFGDEPPLLDCPWSPPLYAATDADSSELPDFSVLRRPLRWRADARVHFDVSCAGATLPETSPSVRLLHLFARGTLPDAPIPLTRSSVALIGLRPLRGGGPELRIRAPGTRPLTLPLSLEPGEDSDLGTLTLEALPAIPIQVSDALSSRPLSGATIRVLEPAAEADHCSSLPPASAALVDVSDEHGRAHAFTPLDSYSTLEICAPGYASTFLSPRQLSADGSIHARLCRGATVRLRVFDSDAAPLRAAFVECTSADWTPDLGAPLLATSARTDAQGWTTFTHISPGHHTFRIRPTHARQVLLPSEWTLVDLADNETRELSLSTRSRASLLVRVADANGPRPDVLVTLELSPTLRLLDPPPLPADSPLPYGLDATTDSRGETLFEDLPPTSARLTFTLPDSPLRLRRTIRLHSRAQLLTLDLSDTTTLDLALPASPLPLELRILPAPIPLDLTRQLPLSALDLEHTARLDRRHARPDFLLSTSDPRLPTELLDSHLLLTSPDLDLDLPPANPNLPPRTTPLSLQPSITLSVSLTSLTPDDRYVLAFGRTPHDQLQAHLDAHPELQANLSADALDSLLGPPSDDSHFLVERTVPFIATSDTLSLSLTHLLPGTTRFLLFRIAPFDQHLIPASAPATLTLSSRHAAQLRLTPKN